MARCENCGHGLRYADGVGICRSCKAVVMGTLYYLPVGGGAFVEQDMAEELEVADKERSEGIAAELRGNKSNDSSVGDSNASGISPGSREPGEVEDL